MRIQKIQWAGILIESQGVIMMIDPIFTSYDPDLFGFPLEEFYELSCFKTPSIIAITHLHSDHYDPKSIRKYFGEDVILLVPKLCVEEVKQAGFTRVIGLEVGDVYRYKDFEIIGEYSVDGLGDEQVSYVIRENGYTLIHCGDTLWHGRWWKLAHKYGPIDVALLPINAAIVREKGMTPSHLPICMGPEQASAAASILNCRVLIPIHYGTFCNPPVYNETETPIERLLKSKWNFEVKVLNNKEEFIL